jgi:hypothetical protein
MFYYYSCIVVVAVQQQHQREYFVSYATKMVASVGIVCGFPWTVLRLISSYQCLVKLARPPLIMILMPPCVLHRRCHAIIIVPTTKFFIFISPRVFSRSSSFYLILFVSVRRRPSSRYGRSTPFRPPQARPSGILRCSPSSEGF